MRKEIVIAVLCLCVQGCASMLPRTLYNTCVETPTGYEYYSYRIDIVSDPPGAKIEWNNGYIGKTPMAVTYDGHLGTHAKITVRAYPPVPEQFVRTKIVPGSNKIPRTIYFDMKLKPAGNSKAQHPQGQQ